jgi:sec-independent protein translocase protein TatA
MRLSAPELIIILLIVILLFGAKRLPDTAKSIGESLKIFKKSVRDETPPTPAPPVEQRQITGVPDATPPSSAKTMDGNGRVEH